MQQGSVRYTVGAAGLASAVVETGEESLTVDYTPPSFPPSMVTIERFASNSARVLQRLEIQILDLATNPATVAPPPIPADYACCAGS
jgi:hypothetical protein